MMTNKRINTFLQEVRAKEKKWVDYGQILVEGLNLDQAQEPLRNAEFELENWLNFHKELFETYDWFSKIKRSHNALHQSYSILYLETMRIYKPKKLEELIVSFTDLEKKYESFEALLDIVLEDINKLPKKSIKDISKKLKSGNSLLSDKKDKETSSLNQDVVFGSKKLVDSDHKMDTIDILKVENDSDLNASNKFEEITYSTHQTDSLNDAIEKVRQLKIENNISGNTKHASTWTSNIEQNISLKEKTIDQLKKEKELLQLELTNLEERRTLNKQSMEQVEETYRLKQQEIDQETLENNQLVEFKLENKEKLTEELVELSDKKSGLAKFIQDLEKEHEEESLYKNEDPCNDHIEEQLEELKQNKKKGIEQLLQQLNLRKIDLKKLKDQLVLLEEDVKLMEEELDQKQKDLDDIDEKAQIKNNERIEQQTEKEKTIQLRLEVINDKQDELYSLIEQSNQKKNELSVIDFQVEELKKNNKLIEDANKALLSEIEIQQKDKENKRKDIDSLKSAKLSESESISNEIKRTEERLADLHSDLATSKSETSVV